MKINMEIDERDADQVAAIVARRDQLEASVKPQTTATEPEAESVAEPNQQQEEKENAVETD